MAHKLIRHYGRGHLHFITFTCYRQLPLLRSVRARNTFVDGVLPSPRRGQVQGPVNVASVERIIESM